MTRFNIHTKLQCSKTQTQRAIDGVKFNIHTKLQCSKTAVYCVSDIARFNIHTKLQCSKTSNRGASNGFVNSGNLAWQL